MKKNGIMTLSVRFKKSAIACSVAGVLGGALSLPASAETESCDLSESGKATCTSALGATDAKTIFDLWDTVLIDSTKDVINLSAEDLGTITNKDVALKSLDGAGIYLNGSSAVFTGKLGIETSGNGIYLAQSFLSQPLGSSLTVGDDLNVYAEKGMGIAAEITNHIGGNRITVGENAVIRTAGDAFGQFSFRSDTGYGVYSGASYFDLTSSRNRYFYTWSARVTLGHNAWVETLGDNAHGVYANKTGLVDTGDITVQTWGNGASGLVAEDGYKAPRPAMSPMQTAMALSDSFPSEEVEIDRSGWATHFDGGRIYLNRDVNVQVHGEDSFAMFASGNLAWIGSGYLDGPESEGVYHVYGDMLTERKGTIDLRMIQGSVFSGMADSTQLYADGQLNTTDNGYIYLNMKGDTSLWDMTSSSVVTRMDLNDARLTYRAPASAESFTPAYLTVVENYSGNNGLLTLNTVLGGDDSLTDQLHVLGDVEAGNTRVSINNIGGKGALTQEGIEIVTVGGESIGTFTKAGRIVAGAYDYDVVRKGQNWYLMSAVTPVPPPDPVPPPGPDPVPPPGPDPVPPPGPDPVPPPGPDPLPPPGPDPVPPTKAPEPEAVVRPESGAYLANHAAANGIFVMRLHDRLGETQYTDVLTGEKKVTSMWLRQVGGHNVFHSAGQLTTQSNRYVAQLGGDIVQWSSDGKDRWHLGVMGGYANNQSNTRSRWNHYKADGTLSGYSAGIYGTWYADNENKEGLYTDSWLIYSWFNNHVKGDELPTERYKSRGITASVETGWTEHMGAFYGSKGTLNNWYIQPKAQAIWMGVRSRAHTEDNGSNISFGGEGNVQTRLGLRAYINGHHKIDEGKRREFEPFIEANWLHNTKTFSVTLDDHTISQQGARNIGELKTGVEAKLGDRLTMWGNVAVQMGGKGYHDAQAMYGIKYQF
ncbi:autotransporter outer membrane beta-barrel domain-containing protein [Enterobacter wuhouensis]|uniref:autotransporter outer membrane beta-barrel domain-containing protein n=1 Tax=Enterobacter wuhouensis TaxID=2529381 RepID=UPI003D77246B